MIGRVLLVVAAAAAAVLPIPAEAVERWYSRGAYASFQPIVTRLSNLVPIALFDLAVAILLAAAVVVFVSRVRRNGLWAALVRSIASAAVVAAVLYLLFLIMWGLNYRRVPLEKQLDYDASRVTREAALKLGTEAAVRVNAGYAPAHAVNVDQQSLAETFDRTVRLLGVTHTTVTGLPKRSLLSWYFVRAAIDGMTDPYFLEIIVNPEVLPFERPFVLAHEWAHLAGYADESEANFVAWLTCVRGDPLARYSGWLAGYGHATRALTREDRRQLPALDAGPLADLEAERVRYRRASPAVTSTARNVYDTYLKSNRVREGIASYEAAVRLMLGTRLDEEWKPALRR
jgi:hypothetical protein